MAEFQFRFGGETVVEGPNGSVTVRGIVVGAADAAEASLTAAAALPPTWNNLPLQPISIDDRGGGIYDISAPYSLAAKQSYPPLVEEEGWYYTWTTGETSIRLTHSIDGTEARWAADGEPDPADLHGAINVDKDGVNGVDVRAPSPRLVRTRRMQKDAVSAQWLRSTMQFAFRVNNAPWSVFAPGEVLFCRLDYQDLRNGLVDLTQEFEVGENIIGASLHGFPSVTKYAHQYAWVRSVKRDDDAAKTTLMKPVEIRVVDVYRYLDFDLLEPS